MDCLRPPSEREYLCGRPRNRRSLSRVALPKCSPSARCTYFSRIKCQAREDVGATSFSAFRQLLSAGRRPGIWRSAAFNGASRSSRCMISGPMQNENTSHQDLYSGLIRLHILHHECEGDIFGLAMIEELGRHGYRLSHGTMYPIIHSLEERSQINSYPLRHRVPCS